MAKKGSTIPETAPVASIEHDHSPFEAFLEKHLARLIWIFLVLMVAAALFVTWRLLAERKKRAADEAFTSANTVEELQTVADSHDGSVAGGSALYILAERHLTEGREEEGTAALQKFIDTYSSHPLHDRAVLTRGIREHKAANYANALEFLDQAAGSERQDVAGMARLYKGDTKTAQALEARANGSLDQARSLLEEARTIFEDLKEDDRVPDVFSNMAEARTENMAHLVPGKNAVAPSETPAAQDPAADPQPEPIAPDPAVPEPIVPDAETVVPDADLPGPE